MNKSYEFVCMDENNFIILLLLNCNEADQSLDLSEVVLTFVCGCFLFVFLNCSPILDSVIVDSLNEISDQIVCFREG